MSTAISLLALPAMLLLASREKSVQSSSDDAAPVGVGSSSPELA